MHAHKVKVTIPADHHVTFTLPEEFPAGPAEVIVLAEALRELRQERATRIDSAKQNAE